MLQFSVAKHVDSFVAALPDGLNKPNVLNKQVSSTAETSHVRLMCGKFCPGGNKLPIPNTWIERTNNRTASQALPIIETEHGPALVLQIQFRAPVQGWVLETAGGLVDAGEQSDQAAGREAKEEMPIVFSHDFSAAQPISALTSCGITNERSQFFVGRGQLKAGAKLSDDWIISGESEKEEGEIGISIAIPASKIAETLGELQRRKIYVCARLVCYIQGAINASRNYEMWLQNGQDATSNVQDES
jgi:hypothetical protein